MTFSEKISKILDANKLEISSPAGLEDYLEIGRGTIGAHTGKNAVKGSKPGRATIKKIIEKLRISREWWETGKGDIFLPDEAEPEQPDRESAKEAFNKRVASGLERELLDRLYKDLDNQSRHLDKALDLVGRLLPPGQGVKSVTTKDR